MLGSLTDCSTGSSASRAERIAKRSDRSPARYSGLGAVGEQQRHHGGALDVDRAVVLEPPDQRDDVLVAGADLAPGAAAAARRGSGGPARLAQRFRERVGELRPFAARAELLGAVGAAGVPGGGCAPAASCSSSSARCHHTLSAPAERRRAAGRRAEPRDWIDAVRHLGSSRSDGDSRMVRVTGPVGHGGASRSWPGASPYPDPAHLSLLTRVFLANATVLAIIALLLLFSPIEIGFPVTEARR